MRQWKGISSKVMLKVVQQRLLSSMEKEMPEVQDQFKKGRGREEEEEALEI